METSIVINREYGSGGRQIGKIIAERTGMEFYDSRIITEAGARRGISEEVLNQFDEQVATTQFIDLPAFAGIERGAYSPPHQMFGAITEVITAAARTAPAVFVGRCADSILHNARLPYLNVFIYSTDIDAKVGRAISLDGVASKDARRHIANKDKSRDRFQQFFTDTRLGDYRNYDLCVNSGRISFLSCADLILQAAKTAIPRVVRSAPTAPSAPSASSAPTGPIPTMPAPAHPAATSQATPSDLGTVDQPTQALPVSPSQPRPS